MDVVEEDQLQDLLDIYIIYLEELNRFYHSLLTDSVTQEEYNSFLSRWSHEIKEYLLEKKDIELYIALCTFNYQQASQIDFSKIEKKFDQEISGCPQLSDECYICCEHFKDEEDITVVPSCNHAFHPNCLKASFRKLNICPICKRPIRVGFFSYLMELNHSEFQFVLPIYWDRVEPALALPMPEYEEVEDDDEGQY